MANDLKRRHRLAREIKKDHPNMQYRNAFKMAGRMESKGSRSVAKKNKHKKGKRVGSRYKCVHVVKKVGSISDANRLKKEAIKILQERQSWLLLQMRHETNGKVRDGLKKQEAALHKEINLLSK
jgi:hypothetical protein